MECLFDISMKRENQPDYAKYDDDGTQLNRQSLHQVACKGVPEYPGVKN